MKLLTHLAISTPPMAPRAVDPPDRFHAPEVGPFFAQLAGAALGEGAYRVHAADEIERWNTLAVGAFPALEGVIWCFASDWMGRQFALTTEPAPGRQHGVYLLEPSSGTAYHTDRDFTSFHEELLAEDPQAVLELTLYSAWRAGGGAVPVADQCVELLVPQFLGGEVDVSNLAMTDMEVHWTLTAQLLAEARRRADGTPIRRVRAR